MNLKEFDSFRLADAISFHNELNPKLWRGNKLIPLVKDQLETIAQDFLEELGIHDLDVRDITISGSNAAYSYTPHSDLDLHILVNMSDLPQNEVYKELFNAKKTIYNDTHNITVHGVPVELYVQDANEPVKSLGEYSLMQDKWLRIPTKRRANFDQTATKAKYDKLLELVKTALKTKDSDKLNRILKKIKQYRQAGLDKGGEFGPENLAYKALRSQGYITKLYDLRDKLHSEKLSIESMYQEDYDPNGPPTGPEFKPTMPKGTVRVDVSDVYDWYKLGQHISNMKGLGKHDFGKGPPSTIMAFGDEDLEHQYIQALKKTGLSTTDIDPAGHKKIKGQKVDPTYNVLDEAKMSIRSQIINDVQKNGPGEYFVRFTDSDKLGFSQKQMFGKTPDIGDTAFDVDNIGQNTGRRVLWFYPLSYYLKNYKDVYASEQPYVWLVKLKPNAWLQKVKRGDTKKLEAPSGKQRVGILRMSDPPAALFFSHGYDVIGKYQDYSKQHVPHGQVKGRPEPSFFDKVRGIDENSDEPKQASKSAIYSTDVYGMTAYHSKCLEPGCDWESKRYDSIKLAQNAAQKHAQKHFKKGVAEGNLNEIYKMPPTKNSSQGMTVWAYNDAIEKKSPVVYQKNNVVIFRANNDLLRYIVLQDNQPVLYIGFTKFLDGYKSGTVATEMAGRGKGLAQQAYLNASEILGVPIYSDSTQTDASRLGIWNKLIQQYPNRVVGYDQKSGSDLPLEITDQGPVVNQNQPIYVDRKSSKNNKLIGPNDKSRTRLLKLLPNTQQGVTEGYSNTTFNVDRRKLNVPALIQKGAIFVTYPHGEQGWETDNKEDWAFSLLSLYNVFQGGWPSEAKKYLKPESYKRAEQQINSSAPNLGSDKLVYDGKYNQILWSIKKLGIPDDIAFLDKGQQSVAEGSDLPQYLYHVTPTKNLKSIAKNGLKPTVGDRASQITGEKSGIYVFPDKTSAEDAVMNWLGDEFDDEPLTMLKIDISGLENHISKGADYELIVGTTIDPGRIKKVNINLEEGVTEAFDQPYKLKWEKGDHGDVDAYTQLPDGNYLSIMFNKEYNQDNEEAWSVEFYRNNSQEVTGEGDAQRVFATVLGAIQTFIKKYKPNRIIFSASKEVEPGQNAQSRANLYDRLVQRYAKSWGFKAFRADTGNKVIYELNRIKKEVEESASGYIPSNAQKNDPRFKTALTVDIKPDTMKKDAKKFGNKISRAGIPPTLKPSGKF